ncbi:spermatogenesis associated protein 5 [Gonapodya sp. JEL0774]|nr:spermatogenesis associated protein 5 [Gonapodya sp. JEL0774]
MATCILNILNDTTYLDKGTATRPAAYVSEEGLLGLLRDIIEARNNVQAGDVRAEDDAHKWNENTAISVDGRVGENGDGPETAALKSAILEGTWSLLVAVPSPSSSLRDGGFTLGNSVLFELKMLTDSDTGVRKGIKSRSQLSSTPQSGSTRLMVSKADVSRYGLKTKLELPSLLVPTPRLPLLTRIVLRATHAHPTHSALPSWPFFPYSARRLRSALVGKVVRRGDVVRVPESEIRASKRRPEWTSSAMSLRKEMDKTNSAEVGDFEVIEATTEELEAPTGTGANSAMGEGGDSVYAIITCATTVELRLASPPDVASTSVTGTPATELPQLTIDDREFDEAVEALGAGEGANRALHLLRLAHPKSVRYKFLHDLGIPPPDSILLTGPSGSGKSRLLASIVKAESTSCAVISAGLVVAEGASQGGVSSALTQALRKVLDGRTANTGVHISLMVIIVDHLELILRCEEAAADGGESGVENSGRDSEDEGAVDGLVEAGQLVRKFNENSSVVRKRGKLRAVLVGVSAVEPSRLPARANEVFGHFITLVSSPVPSRDRVGDHSEIAIDFWNSDGDPTSSLHPSLEPLVQNVIRYPLLAALGLPPAPGALLYGPSIPPSQTASLAQALGRGYARIRLTDLVKGEVGAGERELKGVFESCRRQGGAWVVGMEGVEAVVGGTGVGEKVLTQLLVELDNVALSAVDRADGSAADIFVVLTTDRPWDVDARLLRAGRIDRHIYISPPSDSSRLEFLRNSFPPPPPSSSTLPNRDSNSLGTIASHPDLQRSLPQISMRLSGCTDADLREIVRRSRASAMARALRGVGWRGVSVTDQAAAREDDTVGQEIRAALQAALVELQDVEAAISGHLIVGSALLGEEQRYRTWEQESRAFR